MPYGFVDQDLSSPVRLPTPAGDYCFIYDCENREPGDPRPTRLLDGEYFDQGLPHPWAISGIDQAAAAASNANSFTNVTYDLASVVQQLRQWRSVVETLFASAPPPPSAPGSQAGPSPLACEHRDVLPVADLLGAAAGRTHQFHDRRRALLETGTCTSEHTETRKWTAARTPEREVRLTRCYLWSRVTTPSQPSGTPRSRRWRARAR